MTIRDRLSRIAFGVAILLAMIAARPALAASPDMMRLFEQGRALVKEGRYEEAIGKFQAANAIEPSVGALLNLGDCYEKLGKPASARARFLEASDLAGETDPQRAAEGRARAEKVERLVGWVLFERKIEPTYGTPRVTLDGAPMAIAAEKIAIDPGVHEIVIAYAELRPRKDRVRVVAGETLRVVVEPPLEKSTPLPLPPPPPPPPIREPAEEPGLGATRWAAIGAGAVGIAGLGVGAAFGVIAIGKRNDLDALCPGYPSCPDAQRADVKSKYDSAKGSATISTVGIVAGGVLLGAGIVLWLIAPSSSKSAARAPSPSEIFEVVF